MTLEHTPTPWEETGRSASYIDIGHRLPNPDHLMAEPDETAYRPVCRVHRQVEGDGNAETILRAVNLHDELVRACQKAHDACQDNLHMYQYKNEPLLMEAFDACKAVLAKVK